MQTATLETWISKEVCVVSVHECFFLEREMISKAMRVCEPNLSIGLKLSNAD